jgi:hypothetical protein
MPSLCSAGSWEDINQATGVKNAFCASHFLLRMIILPRQARDKHREKHSKKGRAYYDRVPLPEADERFRALRYGRCGLPLVPTPDSAFAKTGLGRTSEHCPASELQTGWSPHYLHASIARSRYCTLGGPGIVPYLGEESRQWPNREDTVRIQTTTRGRFLPMNTVAKTGSGQTDGIRTEQTVIVLVLSCLVSSCLVFS